MKECIVVAKKKDLKKLIERIEAIEAEIKAFKETAEKNVATISAEIEKLVAASNPPVNSTRKAPVKKATEKPKSEVKAVKPARKPRTALKPVIQKDAASEHVELAPEAEKNESAQAEPKIARKPRTVVQKPKTTRAERATFVLYNCDEAKSPESKYNRNDETFSDSQRGRRGLWNKLKTELAEGRIELLEGYPIRNVRIEIQSGDPESVSQHLKYGLIEKVEQRTE